MNRLIRGGFARSVVTVASGTAAAQVLMLAATPVVTRLFSPEHFGVLGAFTSTAVVLAVVATLRLDLAVVVPADLEDAQDVLLAAVAVTAFMTLVSLVCAAAAGAVLGGRAAGGVQPAVLYFLPLYVGATGLVQIFTQWLARRDRFRAVAESSLARAAASNGWWLLGGAIAASSTTLIFGTVIGQAAAVARSVIAAVRSSPGLIARRMSFSAAWRQVVRFRAFTVFGTAQGLVNAINQALPVLVLATSFDPAVAGAYVMANRVLSLPINLVGQSLRQVLYPRLGRDLESGIARGTARRMTLGLGAVTLPAVVLVACLGGPAFAWALGAEWATAGVFAGLTVVWLGSAFMNIPSVSLIPLLGLQRFHTAFEIAYLLARALALAWAAQRGDALAAVAAVSWIGAAFNLGLIAYVDRAAGIHAVRLGRP